MKKLAIIIILLGSFTCILNATVISTKVVGDWKYEVPTAPYGYDNGMITILEKEGQLSGYVKFNDGYKVDLKDVKFEENILKCGLYIDSNYISLKATITGNKLSGTVNTPEGEETIKATKQ